MMENERGLCCANLIKSRLNFLKSLLDQPTKNECGVYYEKGTTYGSPFLISFVLKFSYAEKLLPHPQVLVALGLLNVKPLASSPDLKSISIPARYRPCALFIKMRIP